MTTEQILELIGMILGIAAVIVVMFLFLKYALLLIHEESKENESRELVKARAEVKNLKKLLKLLYNELTWRECEIVQHEYDLCSDDDELPEGVELVSKEVSDEKSLEEN